MSEKFMNKLHLKKGALHQQLGIPMGKKIPHKTLVAASHKGGKLGKRARLALVFEKAHHD